MKILTGPSGGFPPEGIVGLRAFTAAALPGKVAIQSASVTSGAERTLAGFGARLAELRQARGLSQDELAALVDVSRRVIAYYEVQSAQPPGALLVDLGPRPQSLDR